MLNWISRRATRLARRGSANKTRRAALRLEFLEAREVPAILIQVDYTYDNGFFANNPEARATMERVAGELGNSISANLSAIAPSGSNTWTASFFNPLTGAQTSVANMSIGANTIKLFVGARGMSGGEAGVGGFGGYGVSGTQPWISAVQTRGWGGFAPWGGTIAFDANQHWHFGATTAGLDASELDFYSVATHELGHVLGIGTANQWKSQVSGGTFHGGNAMGVYGGAVPVSPDGAHWRDGITVGGSPVSLDPTLTYGQRVNWSSLDAAALRDIGWAGPSAAPAPTPAPVPPTFTRVPVGEVQPVAFSGGTDGTLVMYRVVNGGLVATGQRITPFTGYRGVLHVAAADFNGDGVNDYAVSTGAGPQSVVEILDGRDGGVLVGQTAIFQGFRGGLFVAGGDIDRDGRADLAVSADAGAGPHIQTFRIVGDHLVLQSSFFAFDNPAYRGGARVAIGDLNHDGFGDVVVTTGGLALGRVAMYSGASLRSGGASRLYGDFHPYAGVTVGLNAAVGDMDGDGFAELAVTPDRGSVANIKVWSGAQLATGAWPGALSPIASFFAFPTNDPSGARLAMHDLDGDGRAELVAASGNPRNSLAHSYSFAQLQAGGAGAPGAYPLGTVTLNGLYAGLHTADTTAPAAQPADTAVHTASAAPSTDEHAEDPLAVVVPWAKVATSEDDLLSPVHVG